MWRAIQICHLALADSRLCRQFQRDSSLGFGTDRSNRIASCRWYEAELCLVQAHFKSCKSLKLNTQETGKEDQVRQHPNLRDWLPELNQAASWLAPQREAVWVEPALPNQAAILQRRQLSPYPPLWTRADTPQGGSDCYRRHWAASKSRQQNRRD